jgi:hypothetical protein
MLILNDVCSLRTSGTRASLPSEFTFLVRATLVLVFTMAQIFRTPGVGYTHVGMRQLQHHHAATHVIQRQLPSGLQPYWHRRCTTFSFLEM